MTDYTENKIDSGSTVLIEAHDHSYYPATLTKGKAVFNSRYYSWSEYFGDEYLEDGDEVHTVWIAS